MALCYQEADIDSLAFRKQIEKLKNKAKCLGPSGNSWYLAETIFQYILNSAEDRQVDPIDDTSLRSFLDSEGRVKSQRDLRIAIYRRGIDSSLRRVIWKHLLNVYPEAYTGQERMDFVRIRCETYRQMRDLWQRNVTSDPEVASLSHMILKDVRRTDRHHPFYANSGECEEDNNPNVTCLYNLLMTYALNHQFRYCQGMSDLASPILYVMKGLPAGFASSQPNPLCHADEAHAYISFCALMQRLGENFCTDGKAINRKFRHLAQLVRQYDPEFYSYLQANGAHELLFCYRWILLDLKREFAFEDTLRLLEVLWASIPPLTSAPAYLNLFDPDHLYTPSRTLADPSPRPGPKSPPESTPLPRKRPSLSHVRSIKFLPTVLSSDSQALDSPTLSECSDLADLGHCRSEKSDPYSSAKPWDSPNLTRKDGKSRFDFDLPSGSLCGECRAEGCLVGAKSAECALCDDVASCFTNDSGIQHSAASDLDDKAEVSVAASVGSGQSDSSLASVASRRRHLHCLRSAHCNGDNPSDSDSDNDSLVTLPRQPSQPLATAVPEPTGGKGAKAVGPLAKAENLLSLGRSASVDSLHSGVSLDRPAPSGDRPVHIHTDLVRDRINEEFNLLSARSVSEEMLNQTILQMENLAVCEAQSSGSASPANQSSNSSLVILPAAGRVGEESAAGDSPDQLISPHTLGPTDAFMLFLCLTILLQNRNHIMGQKMDRNDIQMFFDGMVRKHNVRSVLNDARHLFHTYLSQWHKQC